MTQSIFHVSLLKPGIKDSINVQVSLDKEGLAIALPAPSPPAIVPWSQILRMQILRGETVRLELKVALAPGAVQSPRDVQPVLGKLFFLSRHDDVNAVYPMMHRLWIARLTKGPTATANTATPPPSSTPTPRTPLRPAHVPTPDSRPEVYDFISPEDEASSARTTNPPPSSSSTIPNLYGVRPVQASPTATPPRSPRAPPTWDSILLPPHSSNTSHETACSPLLPSASQGTTPSPLPTPPAMLEVDALFSPQASSSHHVGSMTPTTPLEKILFVIQSGSSSSLHSSTGAKSTVASLSFQQGGDASIDASTLISSATPTSIDFASLAAPPAGSIQSPASARDSTPRLITGPKRRRPVEKEEVRAAATWIVDKEKSIGEEEEEMMVDDEEDEEVAVEEDVMHHDDEEEEEEGRSMPPAGELDEIVPDDYTTSSFYASAHDMTSTSFLSDQNDSLLVQMAREPPDQRRWRRQHPPLTPPLEETEHASLELSSASEMDRTRAALTTSSLHPTRRLSASSLPTSPVRRRASLPTATTTASTAWEELLQQERCALKETLAALKLAQQELITERQQKVQATQAAEASEARANLLADKMMRRDEEFRFGIQRLERQLLDKQDQIVSLSQANRNQEEELEQAKEALREAAAALTLRQQHVMHDVALSPRREEDEHENDAPSFSSPSLSLVSAAAFQSPPLASPLLQAKAEVETLREQLEGAYAEVDAAQGDAARLRSELAARLHADESIREQLCIEAASLREQLAALTDQMTQGEAVRVEQAKALLALQQQAGRAEHDATAFATQRAQWETEQAALAMDIRALVERVAGAEEATRVEEARSSVVAARHVEQAVSLAVALRHWAEQCTETSQALVARNAALEEALRDLAEQQAEAQSARNACEELEARLGAIEDEKRTLEARVALAEEVRGDASQASAAALAQAVQQRDEAVEARDEAVQRRSAAELLLETVQRELEDAKALVESTEQARDGVNALFEEREEALRSMQSQIQSLEAEVAIQRAALQQEATSSAAAHARLVTLEASCSALDEALRERHAALDLMTSRAMDAEARRVTLEMQLEQAKQSVDRHKKEWRAVNAEVQLLTSNLHAILAVSHVANAPAPVVTLAASPSPLQDASPAHSSPSFAMSSGLDRTPAPTSTSTPLSTVLLSTLERLDTTSRRLQEACDAVVSPPLLVETPASAPQDAVIVVQRNPASTGARSFVIRSEPRPQPIRLRERDLPSSSGKKSPELKQTAFSPVRIRLATASPALAAPVVTAAVAVTPTPTPPEAAIAALPPSPETPAHPVHPVLVRFVPSTKKSFKKASRRPALQFMTPIRSARESLVLASLHSSAVIDGWTPGNDVAQRGLYDGDM